MVILIGGASHTGKTLLAQKLMERYRYPVLSLDLLKMGLIRSGQTDLTPEDDDLLAPYLWGIAREMVRTALENGQNLIVEGCYIPFDWEADFTPSQLEEVRFCCLVMTKAYLMEHGEDVIRFENAIERRLCGGASLEELVEDNARALASCEERGLPCCLIDGAYEVGVPELVTLAEGDLGAAARLFRETVHAVNARDYSPEQLAAWAPCGDEHAEEVVERLLGQLVVGVRECGILIGFGSLDESGDVDMLFVHKDRQGQGVGRAILEELERVAAERGQQTIATFSSVTARPFFERMGYAVERENVAVRGGVALPNCRMAKQLGPRAAGQEPAADGSSRLARFEALLADLEKEQAEVEARVADLTAAGKQKTATFKQLLARKLSLRQFLDAFDQHGLRGC